MIIIKKTKVVIIKMLLSKTLGVQLNFVKKFFDVVLITIFMYDERL